MKFFAFLAILLLAGCTIPTPTNKTNSTETIRFVDINNRYHFKIQASQEKINELKKIGGTITDGYGNGSTYKMSLPRSVISPSTFANSSVTNYTDFEKLESTPLSDGTAPEYSRANETHYYIGISFFRDVDYEYAIAKIKDQVIIIQENTMNNNFYAIATNETIFDLVKLDEIEFINAYSIKSEPHSD